MSGCAPAPRGGPGTSFGRRADWLALDGLVTDLLAVNEPIKRQKTIILAGSIPNNVESYLYNIIGRNDKNNSEVNDLNLEAEKMLGKIIVTPQTGPEVKKIKRLYIEETCEIKDEFYLSCLVDRLSSKIAFISSTEGGVDIEEVAKKQPEKIITVKRS